MKKRVSFVLSFLILIAFAGFVFYMGWTQFKVPQGAIGIVVSKTSGVSPKPATRGEFSWHWEFLLPTNAELLVFSQKSKSQEKIVSGILPSGKLYSQVYGGNADFSYSLVLDIALRCEAEQIDALVRSEKISSQEDLDALIASYANSVGTLAANEVLSALISGEIANITEAAPVVDAFVKKSNENSDFTVDSIVISSSMLPDIALYKSAAERYDGFVKSLEEASLRDAEENSRFGKTMQKMEILGEMLKKYPELSEFFKNTDNIERMMQILESAETN